MDIIVSFALKLALILIAIFMILLILVQRGRGGGLAGALGGPGGSSAFGTKAGDTFTRITSYTALVWMAVCIVAWVYYSNPTDSDSFATADQLRKSATAPAGGMGTTAEDPSTASGESPAGTSTPATDSPSATDSP